MGQYTDIYFIALSSERPWQQWYPRSNEHHQAPRFLIPFCNKRHQGALEKCLIKTILAPSRQGRFKINLEHPVLPDSKEEGWGYIKVSHETTESSQWPSWNNLTKTKTKTNPLKRNSVLYLFFLKDIKRDPIHISTQKHLCSLYFPPHIILQSIIHSHRMFLPYPPPTQLSLSLPFNSFFLNSLLYGST